MNYKLRKAKQLWLNPPGLKNEPSKWKRLKNRKNRKNRKK